MQLGKALDRGVVNENVVLHDPFPCAYIPVGEEWLEILEEPPMIATARRHEIQAEIIAQAIVDRFTLNIP
ncbi:hypothetical protein D3C71_1956100 [compost metagenome]